MHFNSIHKTKPILKGKLHSSLQQLMVHICLWVLTGGVMQAESAKSPVFYISPGTAVSNTKNIHVHVEQKPFTESKPGVVYVSENTFIYAPKEQFEVKAIPKAEKIVVRAKKKRVQTKQVIKHGPLSSKALKIKSLCILPGWKFTQTFPACPGSNRHYIGKSLSVGLCPPTQDKLSHVQPIVMVQGTAILPASSRQTHEGMTESLPQRCKNYLLDTIFYLRPPPAT